MRPAPSIHVRSVQSIHSLFHLGSVVCIDTIGTVFQRWDSVRRTRNENIARLPGDTIATCEPTYRCERIAPKRRVERVCFARRELNHGTFRVRDPNRSKEFYKKLLGPSVLHEDKDCRLGLGISVR
jgi:hypothetical protein